jgi:citrate synthase
MGNSDYINQFMDTVSKSFHIEKELLKNDQIKFGLRNHDKTGVFAGLSNISSVVGYKKEDDKVVAVPGRLIYRGIDIEDLVAGFQKDKRFGFEETILLLLTGRLPDEDELRIFSEYMILIRDLPDDFVKDMILSLKGKDVLNILARSILGLYSYDKKPNDITLKNMVNQSLNIIAKFPTIISYAFHTYNHAYHGKTLSIRHPHKDLGIAENFLYMLKGTNRHTRLEAEILDLALVLHAEHGGGNNSTFTMRVTSSSETDVYSSVAAAIGSLKGPLHGGANLKVVDMMENFKANIKNWDDDEEISEYILKVLNKKAYDKTGKIYGMGHAVYTISDPRAILLKEKARELAIEKGTYDEWKLYASVERLTPSVFAKFKDNTTNICINVDFYSGYVYSCLEIPKELFTPIFAMARIAGWCTHRIEELTSPSKRIIRPSYKNIGPQQKYISIHKRK